MKRHIYLYPIVLLALVTGACQNNGDIGHLYGTWSLNWMTADGELPDGFHSGRTLWSFQNNVICISYDYGTHDPFNRFGTWSESADGHQLLLDFTHSDDATAPGEGAYEAPQWIGMTTNAVNVLTLVESSKRNMTYTMTADDGTVYTYYLKKTY